MRSPDLGRHDRPVPASYVVATVVVVLVVLTCFAWSRWLPWFVTDAGIAVGPDGAVSSRGLLSLGLVAGVVVASGAVLAFRWPLFAIAVALLPVLPTVLDHRSAPLHFGVLAGLGAVAVTSSWRRPRTSIAAIATAEAVVLVWLTSGVSLAAPFGATIYLAYTDRSQVAIVYTVALTLLLAFVLWFRSVATGEEERRALAARAGQVADQAAVVAERARLARDLHDVVAHHVSLIAVRAETAPYTEPGLDTGGRRVLAEIAADARLALDELRGVLGILGRADEAERAPQPTLADVRALVERAVTAGQDVRLEGDLGADVGAAAGYASYRVVQEALTNARKHAAGAPVTVVVEATAMLVDVRVVNVVREDAPQTPPGRGLAGMRERVEALDGRLRITREAGRFEVAATLPTGGAGGR